MLDPAKFRELKGSGELPSPKGFALKVIELCQRDTTTLPEIIDVLRTDPAMVGHLLRLANSAAFARQRPVVALTPDVLMSIGIQTLRQVTLAFSLITLNRTGSCPGFDYNQFWSRSVAMGVASQLLGTLLRVAPPAELFTVGLLANTGRLGLASLYPEAYCKLLAETADAPAKAVCERETGAFGFDHAELSAALLADWGLPRLFVDAVSRHETESDAGLSPTTRSDHLAHCLRLAARLVDILFAPAGTRQARFAALVEQAGSLKLGEAELRALGKQLIEDWKGWNALLEITVRDVPCFDTLAAADPAAEPAAEPVSEQLTILVVDDDPTLCLLLGRLLSNQGHDVLVANNGEEGLAKVLEYRPQVVITDLLMPHADGLKLIADIRRSERGRDTYIMVLTVLDDRTNMAAAFANGADDYLTKPVDGKELEARLKACQRFLREQTYLKLEQKALQERLHELELSRSRASEQSITDPETGLYSAAFGLESLSLACLETDRSRLPLAILLLELPSAPAGLLPQLAEQVRARIRASDIPSRLGAGRLLVIAPGSSLIGAARLAERIRSASAAQADGPLADLRVGIAEMTPDLPTSQALLAAAEQSLAASPAAQKPPIPAR